MAIMLSANTQKCSRKLAQKCRKNEYAPSTFQFEKSEGILASETSEKLTPMMRQYWDIKNQHPDKILLYRMGDFYEMFYDDAKTAAPILNIALTSRNKNSETETPMCGVPYHSIAGQIGKLLAAGLRVAICDQLEDPETAKGIVKRGVTRTLSPGMVYDPDSLESLQANYVAAFDDSTVSFLDASTGEAFYYRLLNGKTAHELMSVLSPVEIVLSSEQRSKLDEKIATLQTLLSVSDRIETEWPGRFAGLPESALRLLTYAVEMQGPKILSAINQFAEKNLGNVLPLSELVIRHLELFKSYRGEERGSFFFAINRCRTSAGARLLKEWVRFPLIKKNLILERQNFIRQWTERPLELKKVREVLGQLGDVERRLAKISYNNCNVRDLVSLADCLSIGLRLSQYCEMLSAELANALTDLTLQIQKTVSEEAPLNMKNGGYIRTGVNSVLDELIMLSEQSEKMLLDLEARERNGTGIPSLKIRYNNVFGYYIEVTNTHKDKVPDHYKRKQTLANAERYVTQELHDLETKLLSAKQKRTELEEKIFLDLREKVLNLGPQLLSAAAQWSALDVATGLAWLALEQKYCAPEMSEENLELENSRHPVVEQEVKKTFVPNHISLKSGNCLLLTGPNMAGKSTLMRQVALSALLAQMGSFVPASQAKLPIFDQIFTRIGASDSLSEGLSTFMVEMTETAEMLKHASSRSLVILDEVGRGTSTYDGMSLAQAILEYLIQDSKSMTLFATHYHEITELSEKFATIQNAHMAVQEKAGDIKFLYVLKQGPANKSYGIQVAQLAGLPKSVVKRATELLNRHEDRSGQVMRDDLPLFQHSLWQHEHS